MFKQTPQPQPTKQKINIHDVEDEFCRRLAEILVEQVRWEDKNVQRTNQKNNIFNSRTEKFAE